MKKKKLLLHCCCGPCASNVVGELMTEFDVTLYYFNPSINNTQEYEKRLSNLQIVADYYDVDLISEKYEPESFINLAKGLEQEVEGGKRCEICFFQRLEKSCLFAKENGYDVFATTLTVSPWKNAELINDIGEKLGREYDMNYFRSDFKKNDGFLKSINMSKQLGLYRQNYCGCFFSMNKSAN